MRRTLARITLIAGASAGLVATSYVQALGLGEIDVSSDLNQRFVASIPLTEISAEDLETVTVSVAPNEAFERAGIDRADYLASLDFEIKNDRGRPRVIVTSSQIAREPVLNLLVQARWSGGKILRDYTILLDPAVAPVAAAPKPAPAAVVVAPKPAAAPVIAVAPPAAKPSAPVVPLGSEFYETPTESKLPKKAPAPASAPKPTAVAGSAYDSATGSYGPVAPRQTLWNIATQLRPNRDVSMDQVLLALSEANPTSIQRGTTVNKGAMLRVPSVERMAATSASAATLKLAALRAGQKPSVVVKPAVAAAKPEAPKPEAPKPAMPKPAVPLPAPAPVIVARPELPKPQIAQPPAVQTPAVKAPAAVAPAPVIAAPAVAVKAAEPAPAATSPTATPQPAAVIAKPAESAPVASSVTPTAASAVAAASVASVASSAVEPVAVAAPSTEAPTSPKSPLAQPLPEQADESFIDSVGGIPLVLGVGLLLLVGVFALARKRMAVRRSKAVPSGGFTAGDTRMVHSPAGSIGALGKLGDTKKLSDTNVLGTKAPTAAMLAADSTQQMTQPIGGMTNPAAAPSHESTMILDAATVAALNNTGKQSAVSNGADKFDRTTQVDVDTLHINLGDNDPISEADFHLAYGLYDEAILLLKTAAKKQPQRTDLQVKLAETYFAAGRPMEFQEAAEGLEGQISPAEWSKIAIMGSQICPDVTMFQSDGSDAGLDADFDLAFDEPVASGTPSPEEDGGSVDFSLSIPAAPARAATVPAAQSADSNALEFNIDESLFQAETANTSQSSAGIDDEESIDFMLGQSLTPLGAISLTGRKDVPVDLGSSAMNVDIPKLDLELAKPRDLADSLGELDNPTLTPSNLVSFSLQDLEVSITPRENSAENAEDELNTKLDLARAYVEMGDNDMARGLLEEVKQLGGDKYKQEAASLLSRLPA